MQKHEMGRCNTKRKITAAAEETELLQTYTSHFFAQKREAIKGLGLYSEDHHSSADARNRLFFERSGPQSAISARREDRATRP